MIQFNDTYGFKSSARFKPGDVVQHRRYGYRGVVVEFDDMCKADDDWYLSNHTQPDRFQPWYHVLVHNAAHNTYVAEENLEPDESGDPVNHHQTGRYFSEFKDGVYIRNDQAWP